MQIIALEAEIPGVTAEQLQPLLQAEAWRVWELYLSGIVREIHFRADQHTAVLMLECDGVEAAREVLDTLPLRRAGLIAFDLIPLAPYPGFARLFADS